MSGAPGRRFGGPGGPPRTGLDCEKALSLAAMSGGRLELLPRPIAIVGMGGGLLAAFVGPSGVED